MSHAAVAHHTSTGLDSRKIAFWTFIGSECLLFGSLIATYLVYEGRSVSGPTTHEILNIPLTSISTFDLMMSSLAMVLALAAVQRGDRVWARVWLGMTALLGAINEAQIYRFVSKPWNEAELLTVIEQALGHRALLLENERLAVKVRQQQGVISAQELEL